MGVDMINLRQGDCLELLKDIPSGSVDLILTDPPYGTTACKWDSVIPFEPMWAELKRIIKPNGAIVLFGSEPFSSALRMSNIKQYKYDWVWVKTKGAGFQLANVMPLKRHENIHVFYKKKPSYMPIKTTVDESKIDKRKTINNSKSLKNSAQVSSGVCVRKKDDGTRFPTSVLEFKSVSGGNIHPTQKPVALLEYLIKTYTNEGEVVLDFTMGSGSTGVATINTNRKFIGIELDKDYFAIAEQRINKAVNNERLLRTTTKHSVKAD